MMLTNWWEVNRLSYRVYSSIIVAMPDIFNFPVKNGYLTFGIIGIILILLWQTVKWKMSFKKNREMLEKVNRENEVLINELNHRVKNNLQIAISLLEGQAAYTGQPEIAEAIKEGCNRLYVMSLAFHSIYDGELLSTINLREYLGKLVNYLREEFGNDNNVKLESELDPCLVDLAQAIPMGLILSEAVSNAYKFAFPDKKNGCISITLKNLQGSIVLTISDNGVGLPAPAVNAESQAFGFSLIEGLGRQLSAIVNIENLNGLTVSLEIAQSGQTLSNTSIANNT
ncbi:sensor histidine kinase [Mucilaginibacter rubeus]|uniref:sensor histidine kinase n=1 Tax=Mucilaginibacter rubeus TaxID=2027860 RepID=UPI001667F899|nr:sensor histidine kinase [Mucilaginibacter rubeus]GGA96146.1 hypothetical protein GCM10011500_09920 [Mucilaginibacter rubeus]